MSDVIVEDGGLCPTCGGTSWAITTETNEEVPDASSLVITVSATEVVCRGCGFHVPLSEDYLPDAMRWHPSNMNGMAR